MEPKEILENHARGIRYIANLKYHKAVACVEGKVDYSNARRVTFDVFTRDEASYIFAHKEKRIYASPTQRELVLKLRDKNKYWVIQHERVCRQIYAYDRGEYKVSH